MLIPKKLKHRKVSRGKMGGVATRGTAINFGQYGLKALGRGWISAREIEAARRAMTRYIKRDGEVWIRIFPDKPVTTQPAETGMGGGKGTLDHFVVVVKPGQIMFEMSGVSEEIAREAMRLAGHKISVRTRFAVRDE
ncbi:MAG: 50S ribosomal protein L16 [bacterium]|nr:50S ribosomal protein L16 [bacterium]